MPKYRKKPVEIEAIQFTGSNWGEMETFVPVGRYNDDGTFQIVTLEGEHKCSVGDYVIKGVADEFYPCKPGIFAATYELADPTSPVQPDREEYRIKVKHKSHPSWGVGVVTKIANGGRRMMCEFPNAPEYNGGYLYANMLEVIK